MKRIQPFTISTKLSIPVESRYADGVDIDQPASATDKRMNNQNHLSKHCNDSPSPPHSCWTQQVDPSISPVEDVQEDQTLDSPSSSSSRSIKKIAICTSGEIQEEIEESAVQRRSQCGIHDDNSINSKNCTAPVARSLQGENEDMSSHLKNEPRSRLKAQDLKCSCPVPTCPPLQSSDGPPQARQWELKDFENSLIQLTASLDFREDNPQEKHELHDFSSEKLQESEDTDNLNRPWLRLRTLLKNYQKDLMLALDVSNFYQQADNLIKSISNKRRTVSLPNNQGKCVDTDITEIASQIRMLSETASRLGDLHATLATRVMRKQAEVKHSWARLQDALRNQRADEAHVPPQGSVGEKPCGTPATTATTATASQCVTEPEVFGIMGKDIKEEQNRLKGVEDTLDSWDRERLTLTADSVSESSSRPQHATTETAETEEEWTQKVTDTSSILSEDWGKLSELVEESTSSADKTRSWLRDNIAMTFDQEKLAEDPNCPKIEELLEQVEVLWELLRRQEGRSGTSSDKPTEEGEEEEEKEEEVEVVGEEEESGLEVKECSGGSAQAKVPPENVRECDSGMLTKFLEHLEQKDSHGMWQVIHGQSGEQSGRLSVAATETLEVRVDLNKTGSSLRKQPPAQDQATEQLTNLFSTLTLRINEHLSRCAELSMDILDLESNMAARCDPDLAGLEGLQEQQDDLEVDYHIMEGEVVDMEKLAAHLKDLPPERSIVLGEEVQATLQAWEEVGRSLAENRGRLTKLRHLQEFLEKYLAMIAWAEDTRSCLFSSASGVRQTEDGDEEEKGLVMSELDLRIQHKMEEFTQLTTTGQTLMDDGHHLAEIIRERTDELQSMLGWIRDNWRSQKDLMNQRERAPDLVVEGSGNAHLDPKNKSTNSGLSESQRVVENIFPPQGQPVSAKDPTNQSLECQHTGSLSRSLNVTSTPRVATLPIHGSSTSVTSVVVDEPGKATTRSLGNSICLILSFDEEERGISQVQTPTELSSAEESASKDPSEATHRVSTFLHVSDSSKTPEKTCKDFSGTGGEQHLPSSSSSPPIISCCSSSSSSSSSSSPSSSSASSSSPSPSSPSSSPSVPAISSVFIPTLSKMATIPSCLGEKITRAARHRRRGSLGLDEPALASDDTSGSSASAAAYCADTWPLGRRRKQRRPLTSAELQIYVKPNSLLLGPVPAGRPMADATSHSGKQISSHSLQTPAETAVLSGPVRTQCCYLSMGSTLSFNLPKDLGQLPRSVPVLNVCSPPKKADEVHTEISAAAGMDSDALAASRQQPRPTALPATHQEMPPLMPSVPKQKQFILSPVEEAKHETPWDQEAEEDHPSKPVPEFSQSSTSNSISTITSSATVSSHHKHSPRGTDLAKVQSKTSPISTLPQGEDDDVVQVMEIKVKKEDCASKASVHLPEKLPCCAAVTQSHTSAVKPTGHLHKCLSVHTKIKDLNGHMYYRPKDMNFSQSNHVVDSVEYRSSFGGDAESSNRRLNSHKTTRIIVCTDVNCSVCSDTPVAMATGSSKGINIGACGNRVDSIQPGHWEFEEEEEELKGIWYGKCNHGDRQEVQSDGLPAVGSRGKARGRILLEKPGEPLIQCPPLQMAIQKAHGGCDVFVCKEEQEQEFNPRVSAQPQAQWGMESSQRCLNNPGRALSLELPESAFSQKDKSESSSRSVHEVSVNTKKEPVAFTVTLQGGPSGYTAVHASDGPLCLKRPGRTEERTDMKLPQVAQSAFSITSAN